LRQPQLGESRAPSLQRSSRTTTSPPGPTPPNPDVVWTAEPEQKRCPALHQWHREEPPWSSLFQGRCPVHKDPATVALSSKCRWSAKPDQSDRRRAGPRQTRGDRLIRCSRVSVGEPSHAALLTELFGSADAGPPFRGTWPAAGRGPVLCSAPRFTGAPTAPRFAALARLMAALSSRWCWALRASQLQYSDQPMSWTCSQAWHVLEEGKKRSASRCAPVPGALVAQLPPRLPDGCIKEPVPRADRQEQAGQRRRAERRSRSVDLWKGPDQLIQACGAFVSRSGPVEGTERTGIQRGREDRCLGQ
jgi:hypothetical protein